MTRPSKPAIGREEGGFVLLEILMALVIFTTLVLAWARATDNAILAADEANQHRRLRMLTVRKLAEVRAKPYEYREGGEGGFEEEVASDEENPFLDYRWEVETEEVIAAGYSEDGEVRYLFQRDEEHDPDNQSQNQNQEQNQPKQKEPVYLLEMILTVSWNPPDAEQVKQMRVVTYIPISAEEIEEMNR
ncbi:MAG: type IV pilus modification PilV family protein [Planctomycetota bacterium]|jgi:hypothetical protein